jgi:hypothetical protein
MRYLPLSPGAGERRASFRGLFNLREWVPGTHCIRGEVGPRAGEMLWRGQNIWLCGS